MHPDAQFNRAADNNKQAILNALTRVFADVSRVFEIASGTGQHAVHFSAGLRHLSWHTSELKDNLGSIEAWMHMFPQSNLVSPVAFDVASDEMPEHAFDGMYTSNTAHILPSRLTKMLMEKVANRLLPGGVFCQYGPFKVDGNYTTQSNADFDQMLIEQGYGGMRDLDELRQWGGILSLQEQISMPANNFLLVWRQPG